MELALPHGAKRVIATSVDTGLSQGGDAAAQILLLSLAAQAKSNVRGLTRDDLLRLILASSGGPPIPPAVRSSLSRVVSDCASGDARWLGVRLSDEADRLAAGRRELAVKALEQIAPCGGETIVSHLVGFRLEELLLHMRGQDCLPGVILISGPESAASRTITHEAAARRLEQILMSGANKKRHLPRILCVALADVTREVARADVVLTSAAAVSFEGSIIAPAGAEVVHQAAVMHGPGLTILADSHDLFLDGDPVDHTATFTYLMGRPNTRYLTPRGVFEASDLVDFQVRADAPIGGIAPSYPQPLLGGSGSRQPERRSL